MVMPLTSRAVSSPCRKLCKLDEDGFCSGCGRSLDDIREWLNMDNEAKQACVARARQRLASTKPAKDQ